MLKHFSTICILVVSTQQCNYNLLRLGHRLNRPPLASAVVYQLMLQCWNIPNAERPTFEVIKQNMQNEMQLVDSEFFHALIIKISEAEIEYRALFLNLAS